MISEQIEDRIKSFARVKASDLKPNPKNWRTHPKDQREALASVLRRVGYADAVIARETDDGLMLIDGHLRTDTADPDALIPTLIVDLNEEEADLLLVTLDPLAAMAGHDDDSLSNLLSSVSSDDETLSALLRTLGSGYDSLTLGDYSEVTATDQTDAQVERADELWEKWKTERGQIWELGRHRLMCGDSTSAVDVEDLIDGAVSGMITDPPYNVGLEYTDGTNDSRDASDFWDWQRLWFEIGSSRTDRQVVTPGCVNLEQWLARFQTKHICIWDKGEGANTYGRVTKFWAWEPIVCSGLFQRIRHTDVFRISALGSNPGHPCPKPVGLWLDIIESLLPDDSLYDPFIGSGTTMVAAEQLKRICYGMEIEPKYVAVTLERLSGMGLEPRLAR